MTAVFVPDLVVIPCTAGKNEDTKPLPAAERYQSGTFTQGLAAAGATGSVRILSALYGLIDERELIGNYDVTWGHPTDVTCSVITGQLETERDRVCVERLRVNGYEPTRALRPLRVLSLLPKAYRDRLIEALDAGGPQLPYELRDAFHGSAGLLDQKSRLTDITARGLESEWVVTAAVYENF